MRCDECSITTLHACLSGNMVGLEHKAVEN